MKKDTTLRILLVIALGLVVVAVWFLAGQQKKDPIVIGAIPSVIGPRGPTIEGTGIRDGMLLAVEEINAFGGINGRMIELVMEDAKLSQEAGEGIFRKMEAARQPLFYISTHSSVSTVLAPLAEENEVVLVATLAADPRITQQREWIFRYWPTAEIQTPVAMTLIAKEGVKNLGIIHLDDEFGRAFRRVLGEAFEKSGGTVEIASFPVPEVDFQEEIARLKNTDGIFIAGFPHHIALILQELKASGYDGPSFGSIASADPSLQSLTEADGAYITVPIVFNPTFRFAEDLKNKYEKKHEKPFNYFVAVGYDIMQMMASLLQGEELTRENVKKVLEAGFIHPGVLGTISVQQGEHDMSFPIYPARILGGKVEYQN